MHFQDMFHVLLIILDRFLLENARHLPKYNPTVQGVQVSAYGSQGQLLHGALQRSKQEPSCEVSGYQD